MTWALPAGRVALPAGAPREEWLRARRSGVTATDVRVLAGHGYRGETVFGRWLEKVEVQDPEEDRLAWELGRDEEPVLVKHAQRRLGLQLRRVGLVQHRAHPHHLSSPDRLSSDGGVVELKHTSSWYLDQYRQEHGQPLVNGDGYRLPPAWYAQLQWQLYTTGRPLGHVQALLSDRRAFTSWVVPADEWEQDLLRALADSFWDYVLRQEPPPISWDTVTPEEVRARYPRPTVPSVTLTEAEQVQEWLRRRAELAAVQRAAKQEQAQLDTWLAATAGDATDVLGPDGTRLYSYPTRRRAGYTVAAGEYRQLDIPRPPKEPRQ